MNTNDAIRAWDWDELSRIVDSKEVSDVDQAIARSGCGDLEDFVALISPAAEDRLDSMARTSGRLTQQRFGRTVQLYVPLYLSNRCINTCSYCGFSLGNKIKRTRLSIAEVEAEITAIKAMGFEHILLVTGEADASVGMDYFLEVLECVVPRFAHVSMEVQPLSEADYRVLIANGVQSVLVYQETYNQKRYSEVHLGGPKADFHKRLEVPDLLGRAGMDKIGLGILLGLEDWRVEATFLAAHLAELRARYWRSRFSISLPRLRQAKGSSVTPTPISQRQLVQLICAFRIFDPTVELSLSTREEAKLRDRAPRFGITTMSGTSRTMPGGYADNGAEARLQQFEPDDQRRPYELAAALKAQGYEPVWKDWWTGASARSAR